MLAGNEKKKEKPKLARGAGVLAQPIGRKYVIQAKPGPRPIPPEHRMTDEERAQIPQEHIIQLPTKKKKK